MTAGVTYDVVAPLPEHVQLEITSACNLRCRMCLVRYRPPVNKVDGAMPMATFERLLDGMPGLRRLTLQGLGEPLLSPHLTDMVALAKQRGVAVGFNSNATLLTRALAERFVALGLDWLHVSVDGGTAETYEAVRDGASWPRVVANIRGLCEAKRAAGAAHPWIRVVFVAMRCNLAELPDLVRSLGEWGVEELRVQNLSHTFDDTDPAGAYEEIRDFAADQALFHADPAEVAAVFATARAAAAESAIDLRLPEMAEVAAPAATPGCTWPWDGMYVTSAGVVQPCCMVMGDDRVNLGSLATDGVAGIWNGPAYQDFRAALLSGTPPTVCAGCSMYRGVF